MQLLNSVWPIRCEDHKGMTPAVKSTLIALADAAADDGSTWITAVSSGGKLDLSTKTGLSDRAVRQAVTWLAENNFIDRRSNGRGWTTVVHLRATGICCRSWSANAAGHDGEDVNSDRQMLPPDRQMPPPDRQMLPPKPFQTYLTKVINIDTGASASTNKRAGKSKRHALPEDWTPSPLSPTFSAKIADWSPERLQNALDRFVNHYQGNGDTAACWNAKWRTWLLNDIAYAIKNGARKNGRSHPGDKYANRMRDPVLDLIARGIDPCGYGQAEPAQRSGQSSRNPLILAAEEYDRNERSGGVQDGGRL